MDAKEVDQRFKDTEQDNKIRILQDKIFDIQLKDLASKIQTLQGETSNLRWFNILIFVAFVIFVVFYLYKDTKKDLVKEAAKKQASG